MYLFPTGPTALLHLLLGHPVVTLCCAVLFTGWWLLPERGWTALTCCQVQDRTDNAMYCTVPGGPFEWRFLEDAACWSPLPVNDSP